VTEPRPNRFTSDSIRDAVTSFDRPEAPAGEPATVLDGPAPTTAALDVTVFDGPIPRQAIEHASPPPPSMVLPPPAPQPLPPPVLGPMPLPTPSRSVARTRRAGPIVALVGVGVIVASIAVWAMSSDGGTSSAGGSGPAIPATTAPPTTAPPTTAPATTAPATTAPATTAPVTTTHTAVVVQFDVGDCLTSPPNPFDDPVVVDCSTPSAVDRVVAVADGDAIDCPASPTGVTSSHTSTRTTTSGSVSFSWCTEPLTSVDRVLLLVRAGRRWKGRDPGVLVCPSGHPDL
jgi:hypothetical protein